MKMKVLSIYLFLILVTYCWNQDLSGVYTGESISLSLVENLIVFADYSFNDNEYNFSFYLNSEKLEDYDIPEEFIKHYPRSSDYIYEEAGVWEIETENSLLYLKLRSNTSFTYKQKLGLLFSNRRLVLFDENDILLFKNFDGLRIKEGLPWINSTLASSHLVEGNISYNSDNVVLDMDMFSLPWVENSEGYGIGEWISIDTGAIIGPVSYFLISNGYVSYKKPYLYEYNTRVKKLRITNQDNSIDIIVELEDHPNFQKIVMPSNIKNKYDIYKFEILEVYPGTKWDDTCINIILPMGEIP